MADRPSREWDPRIGPPGVSSSAQPFLRRRPLRGRVQPLRLLGVHAASAPGVPPYGLAAPAARPRQGARIPSMVGVSAETLPEVANVPARWYRGSRVAASACASRSPDIRLDPIRRETSREFRSGRRATFLYVGQLARRSLFGWRPRPGSLRQRMQDVDRPPHVQALSEPARARRPSVEMKALRFMGYSKGLDGLLGHRGRRRHLRQRPAIRPPESQRPVGPTRDLVTLLVHGPMMPPAEQREVRERGRPAVRPVAEMMPLPEANTAAGEAATPVPMVERPP
jgi:hypothetical protein